ncbi:MAG: PIG-L family deacetylase [Chloroflexia bacterium]|nr:PIG-L family deacetylase [Chloroflexia bacterium]
MSGELELASATTHRFISPHYDDIALSCGGLTARVAALRMTPRVAVVFGQEPEADRRLSTFAEAMHDGWGLGATEVIASRRAEEAVAARVLGAATELLPFRDSIYRGDRYTDDDLLFSAPAVDEAGLSAEIVASLDLKTPPRPAVRFYVPLAVGGHVDHRHAYDAGVLLARAGWDVWFYEDLPYALRPRALEHRLAALAAETPMQPGPTVPIGPYWDAKIEAILAYPSQLETIFRHYVGVGTSRGEIEAALRDYAERIGDGEAAERFWRLAE